MSRLTMINLHVKASLISTTLVCVSADETTGSSEHPELHVRFKGVNNLP